MLALPPCGRCAKPPAPPLPAAPPCQRMRVLEQKDQIARKMEETMSLEVRAFHCLDCDTILEFRSRECAEHRVHRIPKVPPPLPLFSSLRPMPPFTLLRLAHQKKAASRLDIPSMISTKGSMIYNITGFAHPSTRPAKRGKP